MKKMIATIAIAATCLIIACTKESATVGSTPAPGSAPAATGHSGFSHAAARLGSGYSQPISVTQANDMIGSYLTSVGYPTVDTALRSLSFDADTLRAYLANPDIVTVEFKLAHQPDYLKAGNTGKPAGMNPSAITTVLVGLNSSDKYVLSGSNGVYDHMDPCPYNCPVSISALIQ